MQEIFLIGQEDDFQIVSIESSLPWSRRQNRTKLNFKKNS